MERSNFEKFLPIVFLIIFISLDTFFIQFYLGEMGFSIFQIILLSFLIAATLDIFSYAASLNAANFKEVPKINKPQFKKDKSFALHMLILAGVTIILVQGFFVHMRYGQIQRKLDAYESERVAYEIRMDAIRDDASLSDMDRRRLISRVEPPEYDGSELFDWFSLVMPIVTTIGSFIVGLRFRKKYWDKFVKANKILDKKRKKLDDQYIKKQKEYGEKINILSGIIETIPLGNITSENLEEARERINTQMEAHLKRDGRIMYRACIEELNGIINERLDGIKHELSSYADDTQEIMGFNYRAIFEKEFAILNKMDEGIVDA